MLVITRRIGQVFTLTEEGREPIEVTLLDILSHRQARIGIAAAHNVRIMRDDAIKTEPKKEQTNE